MTSVRIDQRGDVAAGDAAHSGQSSIYLVANSVDAADGDLAELPGLREHAMSGNGFVWLHLREPSEEAIDAAFDTLHIHPTAAADLISGRQQPKVQKFGEHLFVVLWSVLSDEGSRDLVLGQTYLYIGEGWLLTVQRGEGGRLTDLPALLRDTPASMRHTALSAACTIMAEVIDGYASAAADVESDLEALEEQVFDDGTEEDHRSIHTLRRNIGRIDRAVESIEAALRQSTRHLDGQTIGSEEIVPYLHDLLDDAVGTTALINNQSRGLDSILSSHENNVAARQNKDMRTISSFAALLALPTLFAGLYGMNFKNLPLVQGQYGWIIVSCAMVVVDLVIYAMFKRRHWL